MTKDLRFECDRGSWYAAGHQGPLHIRSAQDWCRRPAGRASVQEEKAARRIANRAEIHGVDHMECEGLLFGTQGLVGLQGIVAKDRTSRYVERPAENRFWLKIKNGDFRRE